MSAAIYEDIAFSRENFLFHEGPVLSVYADVNPARPENRGRAWEKRVKNALKDFPEIRNPSGKQDKALYDEVLALIAQERPKARTMVLFAARDPHGRLVSQRLDLQVDLPVVDLAHGRTDIRWGDPYLAPLLFAADEYEPAGLLHLEGAKWRFYEIYLGEIVEDTESFRDISPEDWKELREQAAHIESISSLRRASGGKAFNKLSPKDRQSARISTWMHRLYMRLAHSMGKVVSRLGVHRLVLMGEEWQVVHFEGYMSKTLRNHVVARVPQPKNLSGTTARDLLERVQPAIEAAERSDEMKLLDRIAEQPGVWGLDPVLDALQMGRVEAFVLPWALDAKIWLCPEKGFVAGTEKTAKIFCEDPKQVALRDNVWRLAQEFGARPKFLRGEPETRIRGDFNRIAALLRW